MVICSIWHLKASSPENESSVAGILWLRADATSLKLSLLGESSSTTNYEGILLQQQQHDLVIRKLSNTHQHVSCPCA